MSKLFRTATEKRAANDTPATQSEICESRIFVRELAVEMRIGIYGHEKENPQKVLVSVDARVHPNEEWQNDSIGDVLSYENIAGAIRDIAARGHISLAETFAEEIIAACFAYPQVMEVTARVEKPDVFADAAGAGAEITRRRAF